MSKQRKIVLVWSLVLVLYIYLPLLPFPLAYVQLPVVMAKQALALRDAKQSVPYVREFLRFFPDAEISFSYGQNGRTEVNCLTGLYGRYVFLARTPVTFNLLRTSVVSYGDPFFHLMEVGVIESKDGTKKTGWVPNTINKDFGKDDWNKLVAAGGSLEALGITPITDQPIEGFTVSP